ncbi:hypothetical protein PVPAM_110069500 [Plasmodium vivax]|nr:hypothetical protein PVPAM_110069500 [Plasmodium vivax]
MSNPSPKPDYFDYYLYAQVKDKFKTCNYREDNADRFKNIINRFSKKPEAANWSDSIFTCLHKYLAVYHGFLPLDYKDCCRYVNFCIIKSKNYAMNDDTCAKLYINTVYYNAGIDDYYDNHPDFYNKISQIKTFIKPQKLLEEQRKEEERKQAEKLKKELEEAEQLKKDLERKEQERLNRERQEFEDQERMKKNQKAIEFQQEVSKLTVDPRSVRESVDIGVLEQSTLPKDRVSLDPSGRFRISEAEIPEGYGIQSVEIDYLKEGNARTEPKTFLGSTGFPGYITDVFRSVEPAPILGVSGGMGALFLLFKYTPVGSFFGGRRRRFRQIPSSFGGFTPGDFANFQEYGGGHVGYSPMDIPHLAE